MRAVVFHGNGDLRLDSVPEPSLLEQGDAIVRVSLSSICASDIHIKQHGEQMLIQPGTILGHEFVGVVEQVGRQVRGFSPGDRVAVSSLFSCGECFYCRQGLISQCPQGSIFGGKAQVPNHGAHAERVRVPFASRVMQPIPADLRDRDALFVGDILSTGLFGVELGGVSEGDTVAVVGAGPVGLCALATAKLFGPKQLISLEIESFRRGVVREQGLAHQVLDPGGGDPVEAVRSLTQGRGADVVVDTVGAASLDMALDLARPGGTLALIGVYPKSVRWPIHKHWWRKLTIRTGLVEPKRMDWLLDLLAQGSLSTGFLITHELPLGEILKGYEIMEQRSQDVLKVMIRH